MACRRLVQLRCESLSPYNADLFSPQLCFAHCALWGSANSNPLFCLGCCRHHHRRCDVRLFVEPADGDETVRVQLLELSEDIDFVLSRLLTEDHPVRTDTVLRWMIAFSVNTGLLTRLVDVLHICSEYPLIKLL